MTRPPPPPSAELLRRFESFKSPASRLLGLELLGYDPESRAARMGFHAPDSFVNVLGGVQGGLVAAMLDEAAGVGARLGLETDMVLPTLDLRVSFLSSAPPGRLYADTRCLRTGRRAAFLEADLITPDERMVARMNVTAIVSRLASAS